MDTRTGRSEAGDNRRRGSAGSSSAVQESLDRDDGLRTMSEGFRTPPEELQRLVGEIAEMKSTLREITARLSRIEQHVKRAFGVAKAAPDSTRRQRPPKIPLP